MKLTLLVLRTADLEALRTFYTALGASFASERHGNGPEHYAATLEQGTVLEIYPLSAGAVPDTSLRFGLSVKDIGESLQRIGQQVVPRQTPWGLRALVRDPEGRTIELLQDRD